MAYLNDKCNAFALDVSDRATGGMVFDPILCDGLLGNCRRESKGVANFTDYEAKKQKQLQRREKRFSSFE